MENIIGSITPRNLAIHPPKKNVVEKANFWEDMVRLMSDSWALLGACRFLPFQGDQGRVMTSSFDVTCANALVNTILWCSPYSVTRPSIRSFACVSSAEKYARLWQQFALLLYG